MMYVAVVKLLEWETDLDGLDGKWFEAGWNPKVDSYWWVPEITSISSQSEVNYAEEWIPIWDSESGRVRCNACS